MRALRMLLPTLLLAMSAWATAACTGSADPTGPDGLIHVGEGEVAGAGTIRHTDSFGGFWYLEAEGGEIYLPTALPDAFRRDGLPVTFFGRLRPDVPTTVMVGTVVELSSLVPRQRWKG